jgi:hypothetical protein
LVVAALMVVSALAASAAGPVSKFVFSPSPIGTVSTVSPGATVAVTLTAQDTTGNPVPGGIVYLSFAQALGGGTAFVGTTGLVVKPHAFTADGSGHVGITYTAPPSFPSKGCDDIKAQNGQTHFTSTAFNGDAFCFSPITSLSFTPKPIAREGTLGTSSHVTVTLTVFQGSGRLVSGTVWVSFSPDVATSGASASVNGLALTKTPTAETTNSNGQVFVVYSTGTTLPGTGSDKLFARNDSRFATISTSDAYQY